MNEKNRERLSEYIRLVEADLKKYNACPQQAEAQKNLLDAMNYSLEAGGKRIRPVLVLEFWTVYVACHNASPDGEWQLVSILSDIPQNTKVRGRPPC